MLTGPCLGLMGRVSPAHGAAHGSLGVQACIICPKGDMLKALELLQAGHEWTVKGLTDLHMLEVLAVAYTLNSAGSALKGWALA